MPRIARLVNNRVVEIIDTMDGVDIENFPAEMRPCLIKLVGGQITNVKPGYLYDGSKFTNSVETGELITFDNVYKSDIWRRSTEDEADKIDGVLQGLSTKLRRLWDDSTIIERTAPEYPMLRQAFVDEFGQERADQLLAAS